jgi:translation initiation factor 2 beta subunit (eIF-2beta)/eIF-5
MVLKLKFILSMILNRKMSLINIGGDPNDPHYRYKRNIIEVQYLQKQGGMSQVTNFDLICKQLKVPEEDFSNAFYKNVKKKMGLNLYGKGIFKGHVEVSDLEKQLEKMIHSFILCPKCKLPEWNGKYCSACGCTGNENGSLNNKQDQEIITMTSTMDLNDTCEKDREEALYLHSLYDQRDMRLLLDQDISELDKLIDKVWLRK